MENRESEGNSQEKTQIGPPFLIACVFPVPSAKVHREDGQHALGPQNAAFKRAIYGRKALQSVGGVSVVLQEQLLHVQMCGMLLLNYAGCVPCCLQVAHATILFLLINRLA